MKRALLSLLAFLALTCAAQAQVMIVSNCGTVPASQATLTAGNAGMLFIDTSGKLCDGGAGSYTSSVSITRTNDINAYTANDVVGAATGSTAAVEFTTLGPSAGRVLITSIELEIDAAAVISGETSYNLYLYNVTPPSALGDNAAFDIPAGDRASFVGKIALGTPVDEGSTLYIRTDIVNAQFKLAGTSLFGYLVTVGAYTPTASRVYKITLHAVGL